MTKFMRSWHTYVIVGGLVAWVASWTITLATLAPPRYALPILATVTVIALGGEVIRLQARKEVDPCYSASTPSTSSSGHGPSDRLSISVSCGVM